MRRFLLDPNDMSKDGSTSIGYWAPTLDGKLLAYTTKKNNADEAVMFIKDVKSLEDSKVDVLEGV